MNGFSVVELEELGRMLGESVRKDMSRIFELTDVKTSLQENVIKGIVDQQIADYVRKSATRKAPWQEPMSPADIFTIEKALYSPDDADKKKDHILEIQKLNDDMYILTKALGTEPTGLRFFNTFKSRWSSLMKALNVATAGSGLEWVAEGFSSQVIEMVELAAEVAQIFEEVTMPTDPYTFPMLLDDGEAYKGAAVTENDPEMYRASDVTTDSTTFRSQKIIANYPMDEDATEDALFPLLPLLKKSIARAIAKARDNAIINGQLAGTIDTGYSPISSYDARMLWDGLRYLTMSDMKQSGAAWAADTGLGLIRGLREDMGIYGLASRDLAILANVNGINKLKNVNEYLTMDKAGSVATIIDGEIKKFDGVDIVPTQHVFENVNATGVYDGVTVSKTQILVAYKPGYWRGNRRRMRIESERVIRKGIMYLVATSREVWQPKYNASTKPMTGWLYAIPK